jgi:hypothetical protein
MDPIPQIGELLKAHVQPNHPSQTSTSSAKPHCLISQPLPPSTKACPGITETSATSNQTSKTELRSTLITIGVCPSTSLESPEPKYLAHRALFIFNPFRCSKRQVVFPRTPNLLNPSSVPLQFTSVSASTDTVALEMISTPTSDACTVANEALIKVMEAVYAKKHF